MKEVIKISIASVSFTIDKDAYEMLDKYLKELKEHYSTDSANSEIVEDIEERIAELIIEKEGKEGVVSVGTIQSIINILGRPSDIDGEDNTLKVDPKIEKKLYRDPDNKVIGGVCSGLAAFVGMDVVWMRLLFILIALAFSTFGGFIRHLFGFHISSLGFVILTYCVLWIIIPKAKTVAQRCAMRGESQDVNNIQKKFYETSKKAGSELKSAGSGIARILLVIIGVMLFAIGICGIISGFLFFFGFGLFGGFSLIDAVDYIRLNIGCTWLLKVLCLAVYYLPFIGMLYAGTQLCFRFKSPKFKPGLIIFILWIISVICFCFLVTKSVMPYMGHSEDSVSNNLSKTYDTVYVQYAKIDGKELKEIGNGRFYDDDYSIHGNCLLYRKLSGSKGLEFAYYPDIDVDYSYTESEDTTGSKAVDNYIECRMDNLSNGGMWGLMDYDSFGLSELDDVYTMQDSLITVYPQIISKTKKFDGKLYSIDIVVPERTKVIVENPYKKKKR